MIVRIDTVLSDMDVVYALALDAELVEGTQTEAEIHIRATGRADVRRIARERVSYSGPPSAWPDIEEDDLLAAAKDHVTVLWRGEAIR